MSDINTVLNIYYTRWRTLFSNEHGSVLLSVFDDLVARYSEKQRVYHTLTHIFECLSSLDRVKHLLENPAEVELALWFHDVIYDPTRKDNEEQSAVYAANTLQSTHIDVDAIAQIAHLIRLTQHTSEPLVPLTNDQKFLLDIDLAILGAPPSIYDAYEKNIRIEYAHVPAILFRYGRKKLLNRFLNKPQLYHTDYFYNALDTQARLNIRRALFSL